MSRGVDSAGTATPARFTAYCASPCKREAAGSARDREVLTRVENFCKNNALKYEVIDVGNMSFLAKLALRKEGIRTPAISARKRTLCGVPSDEDMKKLLAG